MKHTLHLVLAAFVLVSPAMAQAPAVSVRAMASPMTPAPMTTRSTLSSALLR